MSLSFGLSGQMFIGNEDKSSARANGIRPSLYAEWGYNLATSIGFSVRMDLLMVESQSRYGNNPFIDHSDQTITNGYWPYTSYNMFGANLGFNLNLDWTNIIKGYNFTQARTHVTSSLGGGLMFLTGKKKNPATDYTPTNFELSFSASIGLDYCINDDWLLQFGPRVYMMRGSIDYSPYSDSQSSRFDFIPMISIGLKRIVNKRIPWIMR